MKNKIGIWAVLVYAIFNLSCSNHVSKMENSPTWSKINFETVEFSCSIDIPNLCSFEKLHGNFDSTLVQCRFQYIIKRDTANIAFTYDQSAPRNLFSDSTCRYWLTGKWDLAFAEKVPQNASYGEFETAQNSIVYLSNENRGVGYINRDTLFHIAFFFEGPGSLRRQILESVIFENYLKREER